VSLVVPLALPQGCDLLSCSSAVMDVSHRSTPSQRRNKRADVDGGTLSLQLTVVVPLALPQGSVLISGSVLVYEGTRESRMVVVFAYAEALIRPLALSRLLRHAQCGQCSGKILKFPLATGGC